MKMDDLVSKVQETNAKVAALLKEQNQSIEEQQQFIVENIKYLVDALNQTMDSKTEGRWMFFLRSATCPVRPDGRTMPSEMIMCLPHDPIKRIAAIRQWRAATLEKREKNRELFSKLQYVEEFGKELQL